MKVLKICIIAVWFLTNGSRRVNRKYTLAIKWRHRWFDWPCSLILRSAPNMHRCTSWSMPRIQWGCGQCAPFWKSLCSCHSDLIDWYSLTCHWRIRSLFRRCPGPQILNWKTMWQLLETIWQQHASVPADRSWSLRPWATSFALLSRAIRTKLRSQKNSGIFSDKSLTILFRT